MFAVIWPIVQWILRAVVVKFVILTAVLALMDVLVPKVLDLLGAWATGSSLTSAFSAVSPGVWWFLDFAGLDVGLPLVLSALVTRFLIRRIPFIG